MSLYPLQTEPRAIVHTNRVRPTKTYRLDIDNNKIGGYIDEKKALKQFILKAVLTARFRFPIYDTQYGCELKDLIGQDLPFNLLEAEIKRVIKDALIYDERVKDVRNFIITKTGDSVYITFDVDSIYGTISEEVSI